MILKGAECGFKCVTFRSLPVLRLHVYATVLHGPWLGFKFSIMKRVLSFHKFVILNYKRGLPFLFQLVAIKVALFLNTTQSCSLEMSLKSPHYLGKGNSLGNEAL